MSELQRRLEICQLRLDHMGMRVEETVMDALRAVEQKDARTARWVRDKDAAIDREEVEIEQECIRMLALYQPAAIDLRAICTIIKANNDLERIADLACGITKQIDRVIEDDIDLETDAAFQRLRSLTVGMLGVTMRMLNASDAETARRVISSDRQVDQAHMEFVATILDAESHRTAGVERAYAMLNIARSLERIGDLCTNIAEDIIFLRTGDVVRHAYAFEKKHPV